MESYITHISTAVLFAEGFLGMTINMIIVAIQFLRWKTVTSLEICDKIITCLGVSRSLLMANILFAYFMRTYGPWVMGSLFFNLSTLLVGMLLHSAELWITTVLCVFYCVKISQYSHQLLILMKSRISILVPRFIVASLIISLASSIPVIQYGLVLHSYNSSIGLPCNVTENNADVEFAFLAQIFIFFLGSLLPFLLLCSAMYLLLRSLWMHIGKMKNIGASFQHPNLEAHFAVVKSLILFLLSQVIIFVCMLFILVYIVHFDSPLRLWMFIIRCAPPLLHSAHLLCYNPNLRQAFIKHIRV
ncbi:taste receptor type 2 member 102-like [Pyxicephalus adspersus]|uniref:Taste receptor type 2 n=1 Tax=Pyxicephalus adspersus TaxID=30357 RepID=A0AAV3A378_PYXAD|nr:TPA: hypothetical protein GDO54_009825 [Pyxicephalus adspersus]